MSLENRWGRDVSFYVCSHTHSRLIVFANTIWHCFQMCDNQVLKGLTVLPGHRLITKERQGGRKYGVREGPGGRKGVARGVGRGAKQR